MGFKFINCQIDNVGTIVTSENTDINVLMTGCTVSNIYNHAFILTANSDLVSDNTSYSNAHKSLVKVPESNLLEELGLSPDTDIEKLKDLIIQLKSTPDDKREKVIADSFLSSASNLSTIAVNIIQILPYINF